jgi:hypothetical protein
MATYKSACKLFGLVIGLWLIALVIGSPIAAAEEQSLGFLKFYEIRYPKQVGPSASVSLTVDCEYAVGLLTNATIKLSVFNGSTKHLGGELWQSELVTVSGGGDQIWNVSLTAPSLEGSWSLTLFVLFREGENWRYFNNTDQGPGYAQISIKVARLATLEIDLGFSNIPLTVDNSTEKTSTTGSVVLQRPVGSTYVLMVPQIVPFENSTRLIFQRWQDGTNATERSLSLDGDRKFVGIYKPQYRLHVNSMVSAYSQSTWYYPGANVTLSVDGSVPASWPFSILGLRYAFKGWSGAIQSGATTLAFTINRPTTVNADFELDYTTLVIPTILAVGIVGGLILAIASRLAQVKSSAPAEEVEGEVATEQKAAKFCGGCGEPVEEGWSHCTHCGKALGPSESVQE